MTLVSKTFELYGKTYTFESGELAKQATGACLVKQGDTTMLDTVVVSKERKNYDFFPLTVDFNEKMYAAGRIPGGYLKREGRPSEKATLTARMIDRPIRPSFPDGFRNEVHIVATSLVADQVNPIRHTVSAAKIATVSNGYSHIFNCSSISVNHCPSPSTHLLFSCRQPASYLPAFPLFSESAIWKCTDRARQAQSTFAKCVNIFFCYFLACHQSW